MTQTPESNLQVRYIEPDDSKFKMICDKCGSEDVSCEWTCIWDVEEQQWTIQDHYGNEAWCNDCGDCCTIEEVLA